MNEIKPNPNYKWAVVGMLWFICFFNYADRVAIASVFPLLEKEFHFNKEQLGAIAAAFMWVYALTAPFAGSVGDRYPRKALIIGGLYVWSLVTGFTSLCSKVWQFVFVRGAEGLGETFYFPASMSLVSDYHTPKTRSRAIGFHSTSVYAGTIFGAWFAGIMGQHFGWRSPFVVLGIAGIALGVILHLFIKEPKRNQAEIEETGASHQQAEPKRIPIGQFLLEFCKTPTAVLLIVAFFGTNLVNFAFITWMPTFLKEKYHLDLAKAGAGAVVYIQLASMVGAMLGGVLADRWSRVLPEGRIRMQAVAVLLGSPFVFLCGYTTSIWILIGAMSLYGLSKGMYDSNLTAAFYDVITPARRSTSTGLMNFLGFTGAGLGTYLLGVAVNRGMTMSVAISSTAIVYLSVSFILFFTSYKTAAKDIKRARVTS